MGQLTSSQKARGFYRYTFEIKDKGVSKLRHTLLINPEEMSVDEPNRANVQQTLGGAYLSLFGQGLHTVNIGGKTGFHARKATDGTITDGYQEIKKLRNNIYRYFINNTSSQIEMFWYNWEDDEYYKIMPLSMRIQRSTSLGLMYRYDLQFMTLESLKNPPAKPKASSILSAVDALSYGRGLSTSASSVSEAITALGNGGVS